MTESLKLIDTFSGIGGFSYAAEKLVGGFETVAFVECEPYCQKVLKKHWPEVPIYDDIKTYNPEPYSADVICGGFPCQSISNLGHHEGITETSKSGLFYELMRVIRLVRPSYVILENVAAILNNGLGIVLGELAEARFNCEWACIPASALGACHKRERIWIIAYPMRERSQRATNKRVQGKGIWTATPRRLCPNWRQYESQPVLRRGNDGLSNRVHRLKALGNSIVPQVAAIPLQRVKELSLLQSVAMQS
jgi:DNA (cytosine-5)-methyltransferase 1